MLWTNYYSSQFVLFFCLAILEKNSKIVMSTLNRFDDILRYMNDLSGTLDVDDLLIRAELLFLKFKQMVELIDRRNSGLGASRIGNKPKEKTIVSAQLRSLLSRKPILKTEADIHKATVNAKSSTQNVKTSEVDNQDEAKDNKTKVDKSAENTDSPRVQNKETKSGESVEVERSDKASISNDD